MTLNAAPTPVVGKSLFASKTVWTLLGSIITYLLPGILAKFGVPVDQQGPIVEVVGEFGPPVLAALGILFHSTSKVPVSSVLPIPGGATKLMG